MRTSLESRLLTEGLGRHAAKGAVASGKAVLGTGAGEVGAGRLVC